MKIKVTYLGDKEDISFVKLDHGTIVNYGGRILPF